MSIITKQKLYYYNNQITYCQEIIEILANNNTCNALEHFYRRQKVTIRTRRRYAEGTGGHPLWLKKLWKEHGVKVLKSNIEFNKDNFVIFVSNFVSKLTCF